jgi:hypothetical protein
MKNAHHDPKDEAGAPGMGADIVPPGVLPAKRATVTADVLARFITGDRLTGLESVADSSTTRLAAVVHYLETGYGWTIERTEKAAGCRDGRIAYVSEYWMHPDLCAAALAAGAGAWVSEVQAARRALRAKAAQARTAAARFNARKVRRTAPPDTRQGGLFDGGEVSA